MPDLGRYAGVVLSSYVVAIVLIGVLVAVTLWRGARVRAALRVVEARQSETGLGRDDG